MAFAKLAKTGLLLFMTVGPLLVFLFLYVFGKNTFELDTYPFQGSFLPAKADAPAFLVLPGTAPPDRTQNMEVRNQTTRLVHFFNKMTVKPAYYQLFSDEAELQADKNLHPVKPFLYQPMVGAAGLIRLAMADTTLEIITAKGPMSKKLPDPPRAFLFDNNYTLRGVYGLSNSLSVDTLMLEYKILTKQ